MTYIIYPDILFLWSFMINIFVFLIINKLILKKSKLNVVIYAGITGLITTYEYVVFLHSNPYIHKTFYALLYIFMIIFFTKPYHISLLKSIFISLASMNFLAGLIEIHKSIKINTKTITITILLLLILVKFFNKYWGYFKYSENKFYSIVLKIRNVKIKTTGYYDSGNIITDHYTNAPVIIIDTVLFRKIFNIKNENSINSYIKTGLFDYAYFNKICNLYFYPLPFKTINSTNEIMPVFKIESICYPEYKKTYKNIVVGLCRYSFTDNKACHILINKNLYPSREEISND